MTKLGLEPLIDPTATVRDCRLGRYTEVRARTSLIETELGDYSYIVNDSEVIYTVTPLEVAELQGMPDTYPFGL
jgi:hypothetical protein